MSFSRQFLGQSITIEFKQFGSSAQIYTGIISSIKHRKFDGADGNIIIGGHSPTILLENGIDCQSYENKTLEQIIRSALAEYPQDIISLNIFTLFKDKLLYTVQYKESDFDFLKRLSTRFGEWFYYNGQQLVFGPADGRVIELFEEQDLYEFELKLQIVPQKFSYTGYSGHRAEEFTVKSESQSVPDTINPFQTFAIEASENIYGKSPQTYINQHFERGSSDLEELVKRQKSRRQNTVTVEGKSNNPNLRLGDRAKITAYMPGNKIFKDGDVPIETYKVIEIHHYYDGLDGYYNTFVGVPYRNIPGYTDEQAVPISEEQSAIVVDNNDPKGMGRIRVQFHWQKRSNEKTPWIRILTPYAGEGKGFHIIPELREEVIVGFEGGDAEKPFILGAVFHTKGKSGHGGAGNHIKGFQTASGNKLQMNDKDGSVNLTDKGSANFHMDGSGNTTTNSSVTNTINVGGSKDAPPTSVIKADSDGNIILDAKTSIILKVGESLLSIDKDGLIKLNGKDLKQTVENNYDLDAKKVTQSAKGANFKINSDQNVIVSGGIEVKLK